MTEEEYRENLIRMWDSVRTDNKGAENCGGVRCLDCPLFKKVCRADINTVIHCYKAIKIVEEWAKEHPVQTNAEKFREVFGFEPNVFTDNENHILCNGYITIDERFWNAEYKGKTEGCEEE